EWLTHHTQQIRKLVASAFREWNGRLPSLHRPLDTNHRWMHAEPVGNSSYDWVLRRCGIVRRSVTLRPPGRPYWTIAHGHDAVATHKLEQLMLLEMRMEFHFIHGGLDPGIAQDKLQLRDCH